MALTRYKLRWSDSRFSCNTSLSHWTSCPSVSFLRGWNLFCSCIPTSSTGLGTAEADGWPVAPRTVLALHWFQVRGSRVSLPGRGVWGHPYSWESRPQKQRLRRKTMIPSQFQFSVLRCFLDSRVGEGTALKEEQTIPCELTIHLLNSKNNKALSSLPPYFPV